MQEETLTSTTKLTAIGTSSCELLLFAVHHPDTYMNASLFRSIRGADPQELFIRAHKILTRILSHRMRIDLHRSLQSPPGYVTANRPFKYYVLMSCIPGLCGV